MHPFRLSRAASSLSPLFHFDSSIHHRAERAVRQQNLDPNHRAIPMPILDTRARPTLCTTTTPWWPRRQSLTDDGKMVGDFHRRYILVTDTFFLLSLGNQLSSLDGVPVAVKDNFCTTRISSSCGSAILKDFTSPYDATVVHLLRKARAVVMGKTNLDEFGMGSANIYSTFGPVYNPHDLGKGQGLGSPSERRVAGGSSGGSAAAVASGMCFAALGSDTGGSVRLPASYCGIVGFKPSYGRCSRWGLIAYANSLDTVGLLARTVRDAEIVYDIISEHDDRDPTSMPIDIRKHVDAITPGFESITGDLEDLTGLRIGIPQEYFVSELAPAIVQLWRDGIAHLRDRGATIVPVSMPNTRHALSAYYVLASAEASSNLARFDGLRYGHRSDKGSFKNDTLPYADTRTEGFGPEVRRRIILGTYVLTAGSYKNYFLQAQKVRRLVQEDFDHVFLFPNPVHHHPLPTDTSSGVHVLLTPAAISTAPKLQDCFPSADETSNAKNPVDAYVGDVMTVPASLAGIPAIVVPFGASPLDGYPIGLQLMAQYGDERTLLRVAATLERR
ncbi:amidase signature domain-containing protein [Jimgerdemannia flammicorona]|uniref:Glutamyl-tRNA(Gln) amidotransferase subunit A, mitochondrial n=1 Tax=Jimgerdemannia flammicorona TaxID=994334 RepID=A0A433QSI6_9FUNG|nr:amidase signature domain-containing protein [Jimgerdemannia flammicorona]